MPSKKTIKNPTGSDRATRGARVSLAAMVRQKFPAHIAVAIDVAILKGINPKIAEVEDGDCGEEGCDCGLTVTNDFGGGLPTIQHKMMAKADLVNRGWGQAAQHSVIETEIKAEIHQIAGGVTPGYLRTLSPSALKALAEAIKGAKALPASTGTPSTDEIEDADFTDEPESSEGES